MRTSPRLGPCFATKRTSQHPFTVPSTRRSTSHTRYNARRHLYLTTCSKAPLTSSVLGKRASEWKKERRNSGVPGWSGVTRAKLDYPVGLSARGRTFVLPPIPRGCYGGGPASSGDRNVRTARFPERRVDFRRISGAAKSRLGPWPAWENGENVGKSTFTPAILETGIEEIRHVGETNFKLPHSFVHPVA